MKPNGWRYPLVGGTRQRHFNGTHSKPRKELENAPTPTTMAPAFFAGDRVHAVLGGFVLNCNYILFVVFLMAYIRTAERQPPKIQHIVAVTRWLN